jgi:hypothetical protein
MIAPTNATNPTEAIAAIRMAPKRIARSTSVPPLATPRRSIGV